MNQDLRNLAVIIEKLANGDPKYNVKMKALKVNWLALGKPVVHKGTNETII